MLSVLYQVNKMKSEILNKKNYLLLLLSLIVIGCLLSLSRVVCCQENGEWIRCSGEAVVQNISTEEAQTIARRKARLDAIEKVCGVCLHAESLVNDFMLAGDFIHSISYGHVVEEKNVLWETESLPADNPGQPPVILLRITMDARVVQMSGYHDPSFEVDLKLNRTAFQSGDEVILEVSASKKCYITILNLAANDSVYMLLPNRIQTDNLIDANTPVEIPSAEDRSAGFHIRVATLPHHQRDTEIIKVIATKEKIWIWDEIDVSRGFGSIGTPKMAATRLARWLAQIPLSKRAEATAMYSVEAIK